MATEKIVNLDPSKVLAMDNIRHSLIVGRVESMAQSILDRGGIMEPVEVEKLPAGEANGFTHRITSGFYRHAAALKLNTEQNAGVELPAIVRQPADEKDRFARQFSENVDRQELTPMDTARTISRALEMGFSRQQVREMFKRPGGRKGNELTPVSNSWLNMHLELLELPKAIQGKVHDGRLSFVTGYQLTRIPAEQREAVLAKAEEKRAKELEREAKDDERAAGAEAKAGEKQAKADAAAKALEAAEAEAVAETAKVAEADAAYKLAQRIGPVEERLGKPMNEWPEAEKKGFAEKLGGAKVELREAKKTAEKAAKKLVAAQAAMDKLTKAPETDEPLPGDAAPASPKAAKKAKETASPKDVKKAAKELGVKSGPVALNVGEARSAVAELVKSKFPGVTKIAGLFAKLLSGELVPKQVETELTVLTGERKLKKP